MRYEIGCDVLVDRVCVLTRAAAGAAILLTALLCSVAFAAEKTARDGGAALEEGRYVDAMRISMPLAEAGDPAAQLNVGVLYFRGLGVPRDYAKARHWFERAASQGEETVSFNGAAFNLGQIYARGLGVQQDYAKAAGWYRRAADNGFASAQYNLAGCYYRGRGCPRSHSHAIDWYGKAAAQGHANANFNLGLMHSNGEGVPKSQTKAANWMRKAAELGNPRAAQWLRAHGYRK